MTMTEDDIAHEVVVGDLRYSTLTNEQLAEVETAVASTLKAANSGSKSPKRPPGRPRSYGGYGPGSVRVDAKVPTEIYERLIEWGEGIISRGIVAAVEKALGKGE